MSRVPDGLQQASRQARRVAGRARRLAVTARRQVGDRVEQRVHTVRSREQARAQAEIARALAFRHGYLVCRAGSPVPRTAAGWIRREVAGVAYHLHPSTRMTGAADAVVLLGDPVDVDAATTDAQVIAGRLAGLRTEGTEAVVRAASRLGGRWTLFLHGDAGVLAVVTDAMASQGVWWDQEGMIASHQALLPTSDSALRPNTWLRVGLAGREVEVHRYWPAAEDGSEPVVEPGVAGRELCERLVAHTRLLATLGRPGVALSEGLASSALLAAYLRHPRDGGFTFTTFEVASVREGMGPVEHLFATSHLAQTLGLPHRVVEVLAPAERDGLGLAYAQTYPGGTSVGVARAYAELPADTVVLHPAGGDLLDRQVWETGDELGSVAGFPEGDLSQRVLLPFNDRRIIELLLSLAVAQDDTSSPLTALADELPPLTPALDA